MPLQSFYFGYNFIKDNNQSLLENFKNIYDTIEFPGDKDNEKVNGIFYKISESICLMITNENIINVNRIEDLKLFCSELNEAAQIFSQINASLSLTLRTYYSIISIVKFIEYYKKHRHYWKDLKDTDKMAISNGVRTRSVN